MRRFDEDLGWSNESLKSNKSFETIGLLGIGAAKSSTYPAAGYHACAKLKPELPVFLREMAIQFFSVWPLRCNRHQGYSLRESLPSQRGAWPCQLNGGSLVRGRSCRRDRRILRRYLVLRPCQVRSQGFAHRVPAARTFWPRRPQKAGLPRRPRRTSKTGT